MGGVGERRKGKLWSGYKIIINKNNNTVGCGNIVIGENLSTVLRILMRVVE